MHTNGNAAAFIRRTTGSITRARCRLVSTLAATVMVVIPVAVVAAPASASTAATAQAAPGWHLVKQVHSGMNGDFTAVVAIGKTGGWAFNGTQVAGTEIPTAWQRIGNTWTRKPFPGKNGEEVVAAGATSPSNVWAFTDVGPGSRVLRWNGHKWSVVKTFTEPIGGAAVVSPEDVWVFGEPSIIEQLSAWCYNGHTWLRLGKNLDGGSAVAANNVWAFDGTSVDNWNGHRWSGTKVASLLPPKLKNGFNDPAVTGVYAQSASSVWAVGNGNLQDEGGPTVILHYNGHTWRKVAEGSFGYGTGPGQQQVSYDGHGGLWLPMPTTAAGPPSAYLIHYTDGKLIKAALPVSADRINVETVAPVAGSTQQLAGGFTHARGNYFGNVVAVILQYAG
jgi:hypothetical protein